MAVLKKFFVFTVLLSTVFFLATALPADAKSNNAKSKGARQKAPITESISGIITEIQTSDAEASTVFLHIDTDGDQAGDTWVAIFQSNFDLHKDVIVVDGHVDMQPGMVMKDYHIKLMNKKVKKIVLSPGLAEQP